jgi:hypothetical protein
MTGHPKPTDDDLRALLRDAAAAHHPDRTVMLNRIAQNRVTGRRPRGQAVRLAGSALAVATVLGVGGVARWALADGDRPDVTAPGTTAAPSPSATASATASATRTATVTTAHTTPARSNTPATPKSGTAPATPRTGDGKLGSPGHTRVEQGPLWSDGSIDPDSTDTLGLSDITLKVRAPITALDVTVRVALTPGLADQGAIHDVRDARIDSTVVHAPDALIYHFVLAEGATLTTGTYVFTAKYAHRKGGRDAGGDTYRARATTTAGGDLDVYGNFSRTN